MTRRPFGGQSRIAWSTAVSAAQDRADFAGRMQQLLEDAGWTVARQAHASGVTVMLTRQADDGFAHDGGVYSGPTAVDALRLAISDKLNEGVDL